jgi:hypothetical protein
LLAGIRQGQKGLCPFSNIFFKLHEAAIFPENPKTKRVDIKIIHAINGGNWAVLGMAHIRYFPID